MCCACDRSARATHAPPPRHYMHIHQMDAWNINRESWLCARSMFRLLLSGWATRTVTPCSASANTGTRWLRWFAGTLTKKLFSLNSSWGRRKVWHRSLDFSVWCVSSMRQLWWHNESHSGVATIAHGPIWIGFTCGTRISISSIGARQRNCIAASHLMDN